MTDSEGVFIANPEWNWEDPNITINTEGFRGNEFSQDIEESRSSILIIGDSFTWGASADPITSSYVDIIASYNYMTFNTGIPGTGTKQYAYLAEKYIPILKPDIVIVMFSMVNDLTDRDPMVPHQNLYHITNASWLRAIDKNGNYMAPEDAYTYYLSQSNLILPDGPKPTLAEPQLKRILLQTVIGTYLWYEITQLSSTNKANSRPSNEVKPGSDWTHNNLIKNERFIKTNLRKIKTISENNDARFMLFLIPKHPELKQPWKEVKHTLHIFKEFDPFVPDFLKTEDYVELPNGHLNNSGHQKYAHFIHQSIKALHASYNDQTQ